MARTDEMRAIPEYLQRINKQDTKIVVGFDGSPESRDALVLAREFARAEAASLHVVFVQWDDNPTANQRRFERVFSGARRELGSQPFTGTEAHDADAGDGLRELAERTAADLIVVGSCHRGTVGRVLLGSVGERLLGGAPCSVSVAPRGYANREHFGLGLIGVAYDGTPEARLALDAGVTLVRKVDCELRLIGVVPRVEAYERISRSAANHEKVHADELAIELETGLRMVGPATDVTVKLQHGDPADALALEGVDLDLLVVGSRGYGPVRRALLGGVSAKLMRIAPCPVLVTPRGTEFGHELTPSAAGEQSPR